MPWYTKQMLLKPMYQHVIRSKRLISTTTTTGPLHGIRILDLTRVLAGPFCTQILGDYGAEVIKIEYPRGGDDTRLWRENNESKFWTSTTSAKSMSLYFNAVNRNKQSVTLNMKHPRGRGIILDLVRAVDVVVDNFIPGKLEQLHLGYEVFKRENPAIIHASLSGPYSHRAGYDVIAAAEAGLLHITGEADGPPTKPGVGLMDLCTGLYLHGAICAALISRTRTGQGQKIEASLFETSISILNNVGMSWLNMHREAQRWGTEHPTIVPYAAFPTKDSRIVLGAVNNRQFGVLCERLGRKELARDERFVDNDARVRNRVELKGVLDGLFVNKTTEEWLGVLDGSGMPYGPVNNLEQAFGHPQVRERCMVQTVQQRESASGSLDLLGIPVKFSKTEPSIRQSPPSLGQDTDDVLRNMGKSEQEIVQLRKDGVL
ncbi:hypothetical protein EYZ11_006449 [Aspergillus tanneri]|uniref:Uncharacterized protein n=1 Tax=Aspergillus tanneri TaxID=1220188 RepID=A0A4S3JFG9_9EURO|nr:hypothetical protein EYZ11_006449 [Aspergillus tanneri]